MIDEIYKLYEEEKNGKPEAGDVLLAMKVFEKAAEGFNLTVNQRDDLWASVCEYSRAVEREAFKGGFHMAWKILQELQEGGGTNTPPHGPRPGRDPGDGLGDRVTRKADPLQVDLEGRPPVVDRYEAREIAEGAFVTFQCNAWGKRMQFNRQAAAMLGGCRRVDMHIQDGKLYIYPTDEGEFRIVKGTTNGHVQICCARIIDRIAMDGLRARMDQRDNHFVVRVA